MASKKKRYVFLDRDGTFLWEPERPKGADPRETFPLQSMEEFEFMDGAIKGMSTLVKRGYKLVMVTNQTFLGTSKHPRKMFNKVMQKIDNDLGKEGIRFDFIMVCPHGPDEGCECRKPSIGGLQHYLKKERNPNLSQSLMFGDRDTDGQFAKNLGVRFVKIKTNGSFELPKKI